MKQSFLKYVDDHAHTRPFLVIDLNLGLTYIGVKKRFHLWSKTNWRHKYAHSSLEFLPRVDPKTEFKMERHKIIVTNRGVDLLVTHPGLGSCTKYCMVLCFNFLGAPMGYYCAKCPHYTCLDYAKDFV